MTANLTDIALIALLIASVGYGVYISRRVKTLMNALEELAPLISEYAAMVDRSEQCVTELKTGLDQASKQQATTEVHAFAAQRDAEAEFEKPLFASQRATKPTPPGMQVVRHKRELVQKFFHSAQTTSQA